MSISLMKRIDSSIANAGFMRIILAEVIMDEENSVILQSVKPNLYTESKENCMENDQLMTKEEFLTLNHSNFSKFKVNPLDLNIAKMQMVISNEVNAVIKGEKQPAGFQNEYKSKDPTLLIGLITIDYLPEKEHVCKLVLTVHSRDESSKDTIDLFQGSYDELAVYLSGSSFLGICKGHVYWFNYLLKKK